MRGSEVRSLGAVGGGALARFGSAIGGVHGAVAGRVFDTLGVIGMPVRVMHTGISKLAFGSVSAGLRAVPYATGATVGRLVPRGAPSLADSPGGALALGALDGGFGDRIARRHAELAPELSIRRRGRAVTTDSEGLARAFPDATPRLALFVHGLCETELAWRVVPFARGEQTRRTYGDRLREELGYTPVYVRYNSGLHISDNGARLSDVLGDLVAGWPVDVEEIVLIGHSMGGLVSRSACHYGHRGGAEWSERVRHVFCLGTPHLGAPLERFAARAGYTLSRLPETRPFGELVNARSVGIKDLRYGSCVEEDWCDCDIDEFLNDRCNEVPFLETATYYFVGATLAREPDSRYARIVGDLLVLFDSASGRGRTRQIPFEIDNGCHLGGLNHFQLLNHPAVYERIRGWLGREPLALGRGADAADAE